MECTRLFRFQTVVVSVLFIGFLFVTISSTALACSEPIRAACISKPTDAEQKSCLKANSCSLNAGDSQCSKNAAKVEAAKESLGEYCQRTVKGSGSFDIDNSSDLKACLKKMGECKTLSDSIGDDEVDPEDPNPNCGKVKELAYMCPNSSGMTPDEINQSKKTLMELQKDERKNKSEDRKDQTDKQKQAQDEANKLDDEALKNDQEWRKNRKELTDKLQKDLADIDDAKLKSLKQAQDDYDKIDVEYIKFRDQLRRKTTAANDTELGWNTQCRNAADGVAQQAEKAFDDLMAAQDAQVRNFQMTSSAGKTKRALKLKRQKILNKYNEFLAKCLRGDTDPGAAAKLALSQKKNDLRDSQSEANDKAARLEKLRLQILDNLNQLKQSLDKKTQMVTQQTQEAIGMLDQDHTMNSNRIQQRRMQSMMNQMLQNNQQGQAKKENDDYNKDLQKQIAELNAQLRCSNKQSKEDQVVVRTSFNNALASLSVLKNLCKAGKSWGACGDSETDRVPTCTQPTIDALNGMSPSSKTAAPATPAVTDK